MLFLKLFMDYMDYGNLSTFGEEFTLNAEKAFGF
jgi:hypothetical protein